MPRDGSGNHSLPAGYEAVTGQTITANQHNQPLEDLSDEITASLPRSGVAAMTGNLPMGGNKITGLGTPTATTDAATKAYVDAAGVADGAKGDITVSSSGATWTVTQATLAAIRALTGAANKIVMFTSSSAATLLDFKDEDDMASDSNTAVPSQQSVKAYVDGLIIDEDDMASDSATAVPTQQSVKAYVDASSGPRTIVAFAESAISDATRNTTTTLATFVHTAAAGTNRIRFSLGGKLSLSWGGGTNGSGTLAITLKKDGTDVTEFMDARYKLTSSTVDYNEIDHNPFIDVAAGDTSSHTWTIVFTTSNSNLSGVTEVMFAELMEYVPQ